MSKGEVVVSGDLTDYFDRQIGMLVHLSENIDKLHNYYLTTLLRHLPDIKSENAQMQLLTVDFMLGQLEELERLYKIIKHDVDALSSLTSSVKDVHLKDPENHVQSISYQHALFHHCEEIQQLLSHNNEMLHENVKVLYYWKRMPSISKTQQADMKTQFLDVTDRFQQIIDNIAQMKSHIAYMHSLREEISGGLSERVKRYFAHALHMHTNSALTQIQMSSINREIQDDIEALIDKHHTHMELIRQMFDDGTDEKNMLEELEKLNNLMMEAKEHSQNMPLFFRKKKAEKIRELLTTLKVEHDRLGEKIKLKN